MKYTQGTTFKVRTIGEPYTLIHYTVIAVLDDERIRLHYRYISSRTGKSSFGYVIEEIKQIEHRIKSKYWFVEDLDEIAKCELPEELFNV